MAKENKEWVRTRELWRFSWYNARESKRPPHRILITDSGDAAWRLFSSIRIRKEDKKMNQKCNNCKHQQIIQPDGATVPEKVICGKSVIGDETAYAKYLVGNKPLKCEFWEIQDEPLEID